MKELCEIKFCDGILKRFQKLNGKINFSTF